MEAARVFDAGTIPSPRKNPKIDDDLSVEEAFPPSPVKNPKIDEYELSTDEEEHSSDEEPEVLRSSTAIAGYFDFSQLIDEKQACFAHSNVKQEKKEVDNSFWDTYDDDFDVPCPDDIYEKYCNELDASGGYDIQTVISGHGDFIQPLDPIPVSWFEYLNRICNKAIHHYNTLNDTKFHFSEVVKLNVTLGLAGHDYITFHAEDGADTAAQRKTFQTKVLALPGRVEEIEEVRMKP